MLPVSYDKLILKVKTNCLKQRPFTVANNKMSCTLYEEQDSCKCLQNLKSD